VRAELRGKLEERLIAVARSSHLHGAVRARDSDSGHAGEAERCSVAQQATARMAMIRADHKARYRSAQGRRTRSFVAKSSSMRVRKAE
jgi:hypothetical protein